MRPMTPHDLYDMTLLGDPRVSPDGSQVLFTVSRLDKEKNEYTSRIWRARTDEIEVTWEATSESGASREAAARATPFTLGEHRDKAPRWSPGGDRVAFVSHRGDKGSQLYVMPAGGGEPQKICEFKEEVEDLAWSPQGDRIALLARDPREEVYDPEKPKDQASRRVDRLVYRLDNVGWTIDRPRHLWVVDATAGSEPRRLTDSAHDHAGLAWSPDGSRIAFVSARHDTWDYDRMTDVFTISSNGGEPKVLTATDSGHSSPSWSPDGSRIAVGWSPSPMDSPRNGRIAVLDADSGERTILTGDLDRNATPFFGMRDPVWKNGDLYFLVEDSGNMHLYSVPADGTGKPEKVLGENNQIVAFDMAVETLAYLLTTPTSLPDLVVRTADSIARDMEGWKKVAEKLAAPKVPESFEPYSGHVTVTTGSSTFKADKELVEPVKFQATSPDGTEVDAWVMRPASLKVDKKYPALLNIHGGPFTQYGNRFFDEFQAYAGAGYAVIYSNPRGSSGYTESWGRAIRGPKVDKDAGSGWGGVDYDDIMAVVDEAIERFPFIDPDRLAVMGGSYGGFMTSWIIGHTNRFKAAISERAVNNQLTMCWTSDIGPYFRSYFGPLYLDDPEEYLRMSPISYVKNVETPVLILHSENDLRCPISQAEEFFQALKILGKDVEFVRFPGESHELSRSGNPNHRVERFEIILDYLRRKL